MATPTILEIKQQILDKKAEFTSLDDLNSTSKVSVFGLLAYVVAFVVWTQYQFFELYIKEINEKIKSQKINSTLWLKDKALEYRHGHPLVKDGYKRKYSDEGYTEEEIEAAKVVKRASVIELEITNRIIMFVKCATEVDGDLGKLTNEHIAGLIEYYKQIKAGGTKLEVFSDKADDLKLAIDFYYDPLVLTETGARIDGTTNTPVQDAVRNYLKNLRFNGEYSNAELEDILQDVAGCSDREAYIKSAAHNFQTPESFVAINNVAIANSGYMTISDDNLVINFKPKTSIT